MVAFEGDSDILALRVKLGIFVVFHVAGLGGIDGVVASHSAVLAGEPVCAALAEYDVAWDDILFFFAVSNASKSLPFRNPPYSPHLHENVNEE